MIRMIPKIQLLIRCLTLIGIILYTFFIPVPMQASDTLQTELTNKGNFDITLLYIVIGIVGGFITLTLLYVGYRKYKGEQKKQKLSKKNHEKLHDEQKG